MPFPENQLDIKEVNRRIDLCDAQMVNQLYDFGLSLLREIDQRFEYLDKKATSIAGFCGAIAALLVSTVCSWAGALDPCVVPVVLVAGGLTLVGSGLALWGTFISTQDWFSPNDWLREECFKDSVELKRYWVTCIYKIRQTYRAECDRKAVWIERAEIALLVAEGLLLVALLDAAWRSPALLHRLSIG